MLKDYEHLVNCVQKHTCQKGYNLKPAKKGEHQSCSTKGMVAKIECRFNFPKIEGAKEELKVQLKGLCQMDQSGNIIPPAGVAIFS